MNDPVYPQPELNYSAHGDKYPSKQLSFSASSSQESTMLGPMFDDIIDQIDDDTITLKQLMEQCGRDGMLLICALSTLPFLIPVSIPGVSTVFGAAIVLIACSVLLNRLPWLPKRIQEKQLDTARLIPALKKGASLIARLDKWIKPRALYLTSAAMLRLDALAIAFGGLLLMAPFGLIPFSNTAPAAAILFLTLGMIQRDGVFVLLGYLGLVVTVIYFSSLIYLAWSGGMAIFS